MPAELAPIAAFIDQWQDAFPDLVDGLLVSLKVTGLSLLVGLPLGALFSVAVEARPWPIRWTALLLVEVGRGAPALILLYFVYFGLPRTGLTLQAEIAGVVALGYNVAAYACEIYRSGYLGVPRGQREAAMAVGLSPWFQFRDVIFPQALRVAIPPLVSLSIGLFQLSSLLYLIAVPELLSRAYTIGSVSFDYLTVLCLAALMYAAVSIPMSRLVNVLERRMTTRL